MICLKHDQKQCKLYKASLEESHKRHINGQWFLYEKEKCWLYPFQSNFLCLVHLDNGNSCETFDFTTGSKDIEVL